MDVSIIVPCRNEEDYILDFLNNLDRLNYGDLEAEVILADGCSDDSTLDQVKNFKSKKINLVIIRNVKKIVSTGLNLALVSARGKYVVRMDVHTKYDENYVNACVEALRSTKAACVGGAWFALGITPVQRAIAAAFQASLANGGAKSRIQNFSGEVDTVYLGAWELQTLQRIGGFDEELVRNQDDELCLRLRKSGLKIFQDSSIKSWYYPRPSFASLFKQYFQYGFWKPLVFAKHKQTGALRHKIIIGGIVLNFCLILLSLTNLIFGLLYLTMISCYLCLVYFAAKSSKSGTDQKPSNFLISASMVTMHFGYSLGLVYGVVFRFIGTNRNKDKMSELSR